MIDSNKDTITFTMDGDAHVRIPAFDASTLSAYTASNVMSGTAAASDTITITGSNGVYGYNTIATNLTSNYYAYNGIGGSTLSSNGSWSNSTAMNGRPFIDAFPEWDAFKKLCDEYPGLEKAYGNLKTIYAICYEDSMLPKDDE
jgi:hypothetical protein